MHDNRRARAASSPVRRLWRAPFPVCCCAAAPPWCGVRSPGVDHRAVGHRHCHARGQDAARHSGVATGAGRGAGAGGFFAVGGATGRYGRGGAGRHGRRPPGPAPQPADRADHFGAGQPGGHGRDQPHGPAGAAGAGGAGLFAGRPARTQPDPPAGAALAAAAVPGLVERLHGHGHCPGAAGRPAGHAMAGLARLVGAAGGCWGCCLR